ncbi:MAG: hypothetical protein Q4C95_12340 [Planctomycetia bacterium]|nr:hypothetical protein [Planctomycetia bacterium]
MVKQNHLKFTPFPFGLLFSLPLKTILFVVLAIGFGETILAQDFQEIKVDEGLASQKSSILGNLANAANSSETKEFFQKYYLGRWTVQNNAQNIHTYRAEVEADASSLQGEAKTAFLQLVVKLLTSFALNKDYYPACRYNAVLTIGMLNESSSEGQIVPYAPALKMLIGFVDSNKYNLPDYVRYGALLGLERHAEVGLSDDKSKTQIKSIFLNVLKPTYAKEKDIRKDIYVCFQIKAIDGLAVFKSPDLNPGDAAILTAMKELIENEKSDPDVRTLAAETFGKMNFDSIKSYDFASLVTTMGKLAVNFSQDELNYIKTEQLRDQINSGTGSGLGGSGGMGRGMDMVGGGMDMTGGLGGGMGMNGMNTESIENVILIIKYHMDALQIAINGLDQKGGIKAMIPEDKVQELKLLEKIEAEAQKTIVFLNTGTTEVSTKKASSSKRRKNQILMVDLLMIQDHLSEQVLNYKELIGIAD